MKEYNYPPNVDVISGFGGGYEEACQSMVIAAMKWHDTHPNSSPTFDQYENIYGITANENDDMKSMQASMLEVVPDCSGAMMQASTNHALYAIKNGWEKYIEKVTKEKEEE